MRNASIKGLLSVECCGYTLYSPGAFNSLDASRLLLTVIQNTAHPHFVRKGLAPVPLPRTDVKQTVRGCCASVPRIITAKRCGNRKAATVYERTRVSDDGDRSLIDNIDQPTEYCTCAMSEHNNNNTGTSTIRNPLLRVKQQCASALCVSWAARRNTAKTLLRHSTKLTKRKRLHQRNSLVEYHLPYYCAVCMEVSYDQLIKRTPTVYPPNPARLHKLEHNNEKYRLL